MTGEVGVGDEADRFWGTRALLVVEVETEVGTGGI